MTLSNLELQPGIKYRPVLKFCVEGHCFPVVYGNGVTVVVNLPNTGNMDVVIENNQVNTLKQILQFQKYFSFLKITV